MVRKDQIVAYNPGWSAAYSQEVERLRAGLAALKFSFHHIGSTSFRGLATKPTIDILAVV
jgi:GrpB-like predicted nucleotidyltransferase (UPF0157 family)